jgi:hypothetical protein
MKSDIDNFVSNVRLCRENVRKFHYNLEHKNFSLTEKKLLECYFNFRKNNKDAVIGELKHLKIQDSFLEGFRCYLIGLMYNQNGYFKFALEYLNQAVVIFEDNQHLMLLPDVYVVLGLIYANRRELNQLELTLEKLSEFKMSGSFAELQTLYLQLVYFSLLGNYHKYSLVLKKINQGFSKQNISEFSPFISILNFTFSFKEKKYNECYKILEDYKKLKGTRVKANYSYLKILIDHITKDEPLYVYANEFKEYPELYHQLEVIKNLSIGEFKIAQKFWNLLEKHNPGLYQSHFSYKGEDSIFSIALKRYEKNKENNFDYDLIDNHKNLLDRLECIFQMAQAPLSKEELIKLIWDEEMDGGSSEKLKNLLMRYRKKYNCKVNCRHSTYWIDKKQTA